MDQPIRDSNKHTLNRSFSFSGSPIAQKVCVEQSFQNKRGETLIRQYSCEQLYDRSNKYPSVQFKESVYLHSPRQLRRNILSLEENSISSSLFNSLSNNTISNINTGLEKFPFTAQASNLFNFQKNCPEQVGFEKLLMHSRNKEEKIQDCTPMEVDTSMEDHSMTDVHSPCKLQGDNEISDNEGHKSKISKMIIPPNIVENVNNRQPQKSFTQKFVKFLKLFTVFLIPIACAVILMHSDVFINDDSYISDNFQAENITNALQDLIYGQDEVVNKLKKNLNNVGDNHLLVFTGGIGVGKTYSANIISNSFQWKDNIIKIVSPQHKNEYHETNSIRSLSQVGFNLVIVDNLEFDDKQSVIPFVKRMFDTDKKIIIILIYTIPELSLDMSKQLDLISSSNKLSESLSEAKIKHSLIVFNKLDADVVRKCIRYALAKKGLIINQYNIEHVLQNVNYEYSGCKGVYTKIALLR